MGRYSKTSISEVLRKKLRLLNIKPYSGDGTPQFKLMLNLLGTAFVNDTSLIDLIESGVIRLVRSSNTMYDAYNDGTCRILLREAIQPSMGFRANIAISIVGNEIVHSCIIGEKFDATYTEISELTESNLATIKDGADISTFISAGDIVPINGTKMLSLLGEDYSGTQLVRLARSWVVLGVGAGDDWALAPAGAVFRIKMSKERSSASSGAKCIVSEVSSFDKLVAFMQKDNEWVRGRQQYEQFKRIDFSKYRDMVVADSLLVPVCAEYGRHDGEDAYKVAKALELLGHELAGSWFSQMKTKALALERNKQLDDGGAVKVYRSSQAVKHNSDDLTPGGKDIYVYEVVNKAGRVVGYYSYKSTVEDAIGISKVMSTAKKEIEGGFIPVTIPIRDRRIVISRGSHSVVKHNHVIVKKPADMYEDFSTSNAYHSYAYMNTGTDKKLHIGTSELSRRLRRWLDEKSEMLNIFESLSSTPVDIDALRAYVNSELNVNNTPGLKKYFEQLADTGLYFASGAEQKIIPVLAWTEALGDSDGRETVRPVKLQGLQQMGIDGTMQDVYALAFAGSKRVDYEGRKHALSGVWITTGRKGIDFRETPQINDILTDLDEGTNNAKVVYLKNTDVNHVAEVLRSGSALRILEGTVDINYNNLRLEKYFEEQGEVPMKYWRRMASGVKMIQRFKVNTTCLALCGTVNGQLLLLVDSDIGGNYYELSRQYMSGVECAVLLLKNKESANRAMMAVERLCSLDREVAISILRLIGYMQQHGEQNKDAYYDAIHSMLACEGSNKVFNESRSPYTLSDLDSISGEILEYIGVPSDVYGKKYSALSMGTSIQDALDSQRMLSSMEEEDDDYYDLTDDYGIEDDYEDEVGIDSTGSVVNAGTSNDDDSELLEEYSDEEEYDEMLLDEDEEVFNMADESLGSFKDSNGMKVTWVMVMNKVCKEDDRLRANATNMETLRTMWMPNYIDLYARGKVEESLRSLWEL